MRIKGLTCGSAGERAICRVNTRNNGLTPPEIRDYRAHGATKFARHGASSSMSAKKLAQHAIERQFLAFLSTLGELFRARVRTGPSRANFFAHRTQPRADFETNNTSAHPQQGTAETAITSAPKNRTKNAHSSPAKAMAVSIPHRHKRAKATMVSDNRAT